VTYSKKIKKQAEGNAATGASDRRGCEEAHKDMGQRSSSYHETEAHSEEIEFVSNLKIRLNVGTLVAKIVADIRLFFCNVLQNVAVGQLR